MKDLYSMNQITRQGHFNAMKLEKETADRKPCYLGLMAWARKLHPTMSLRAIYTQYQPQGIGRDAFIELGMQEGYRVKTSNFSPQITTISIKNSRFTNLLANFIVTDVNQIWVSDIFYFWLNAQHYYVVLIMDIYSRRIIGYSFANNLRAENNVAALKMALEQRQIKDYNQKLIHHSDRGVQYISDAYTELLDKYKIRISMCKDVLENAHAERVNGTIKNGYLKPWDPQTEKELFSVGPQAIANYNHRIHHALNKRTPIQFENLIKELKESEKPKMRIFTLKQNVSNPGQLSLFDPCNIY